MSVLVLRVFDQGARAGSPPQQTPGERVAPVSECTPAVIGFGIGHPFGYNRLFFLAALQTVPEELYDAAKVDGATGWQTLLFITLPAIIIVLTAGGMLFSTFLLFGYMQNIPRELEESAIIDGATVPQRFFFIILPLTRSLISTVFLLSFLSGWNEFVLSLVFTLANPNLRTLAVGMYAFVGQNSRDWTLICAGATISLVPIIILFVMLQRQFVDAFAGAVKN